jgi:hypothetical protein
MQTRTQWTLTGGAIVLGWGVGLAGTTLVLNDADIDGRLLGTAVTLDTRTPPAALAETGRTATGGPSVRVPANATATAATARAPRPRAPRAVPPAAPLEIAPAPARRVVAEDSADSAESAASAD